MDDFNRARSLFDVYQRRGGIDALQDSLIILNEIIESQSSESQKAINLKHTIEKFIKGQIDHIRAKYNVGEFIKKVDKSTPEAELREYVTALFASAPSEEAKKFFELIMTSVEYWPVK